MYYDHDEVHRTDNKASAHQISSLTNLRNTKNSINPPARARISVELNPVTIPQQLQVPKLPQSLGVNQAEQ